MGDAHQQNGPVGAVGVGTALILRGVADGTRTHDDQNHNLGLYQLSYSHHRTLKYTHFRPLPDRVTACDPFGDG